MILVDREADEYVIRKKAQYECKIPRDQKLNHGKSQMYLGRSLLSISNNQCHWKYLIETALNTFVNVFFQAMKVLSREGQTTTI